MTTERVIAVIVSYKPDIAMLTRVLATIRPQVTSTIVVDNDHRPCFVPVAEDIHFVSLGNNLGIAKAQNEGIRLAEKLGATHVLLMDQDSLPEPDMVVWLLHALREKLDAACVGPRFIDNQHRKNISPFVRLSGLISRRIQSTPDDPIVIVDQLIASGSLIPVNVLHHVGYMREDMFIDFVDNEWCFRARKHGYNCYGVHDAVMFHHLGNRAIVFLGVVFTIHSSLRYYYRYRNAVLLFRESWICTRWKVACFIYLSTKVFIGTMLTSERFDNLTKIFWGIFDGLRGYSGPFPRKVK
jgi:rhamnosyltransferase